MRVHLVGCSNRRLTRDCSMLLLNIVKQRLDLVSVCFVMQRCLLVAVPALDCPSRRIANVGIVVLDKT